MMSQTVWQMKNDIVKYGGNGAQRKQAENLNATKERYLRIKI